jgi:hypothetical protein
LLLTTTNNSLLHERFFRHFPSLISNHTLTLWQLGKYRADISSFNANESY